MKEEVRGREQAGGCGTRSLDEANGEQQHAEADQKLDALAEIQMRLLGPAGNDFVAGVFDAANERLVDAGGEVKAAVAREVLGAD